MIENLFSFFVIIALGVLFQILKPAQIDADTARRVINAIVIKFMMPALCFRVISTMAIDRNTIFFPLSAILTVLVVLVLTYFVINIMGLFVRIRRRQRGALLLTATFGNVTFFGLPILTTLYGQSAEKFPLMYDFLGAGTLMWTVGAAIAAYFGAVPRQKEIFGGIKRGLKTILLNPPIWALVLAFIANFCGLGARLPHPILTVLTMLSAPVIPLMIFSVGLCLKVPRLKDFTLAAPAVIIKIVVSPIIGFFIAHFLGLTGLALKASTLEAGLPVMIMTLALSLQYGLDHKLAALATVLSLLAAFVSIPLIAGLLEGGSLL
ncbi:MAG: AEC family transporter [Elusimicrobiota bacterium]|jgi:predicted permease|nr:AEC family transporter [Elusimicrobiota bacterium]